MKTHIHKSDSRGFHNYGWLKSWHSFNFADYFNPVREKFGIVRVLNDELLEPAQSLEFHEYKNLEILIIPLSGELELLEETGTGVKIKDNEVQLVSAGKGIEFSLLNVFDTDDTAYLQVWFFPKTKNTEPALWKNDFYKEDRQGRLQIIACPKVCSNALSINQDVWVSRIDLSPNTEYVYDLFRKENQLLIFIIEGSILVYSDSVEKSSGIMAERRDTVEITDPSRSICIEAQTNCSLLFIETPAD